MTSVARTLGFDDAPGHPRSFLAESGVILMRMRRYEAANAVYAGLRLLAPDTAIGFLGGAEVAMAHGRPAEAARFAESATLAPDNDRGTEAYAWILVGDAAMGLGRFDDARAAWDRANAMDPEGSTPTLVADRYEQLSAIEHRIRAARPGPATDSSIEGSV